MNQDEERITLITCITYYMAAYYFSLMEYIYKTGINSERAVTMYVLATVYFLSLTTFNARRAAA